MKRSRALACGRRRGEGWHRLWTSPPGCHGEKAPPEAAEAEAADLTVALLGMPNTGKSTLYNRLTGGHAQIANWPGLTVELLSGAMPADRRGQHYTLVDLPGIHDLSGSSEDEAIVQRFLRHTPPSLLLVVVNASQIVNQLRFLMQLRRLAIPMVVALNMSDEARQLGIGIDHQRLSAELGLPLLPISAKRRQGIHELIDAVHQLGEGLAAAGSGGGSGPGDPDLEALAELLASRCVTLPERLINRGTRRADRLLMHPVVGLVAFLLIVMAMFQLLYALGAPLQDLLGSLFDWIQTALLEPSLAALGAPEFLRGFLVDGVWLGVSTVATFLPIIFLFYVIMAVVEDSGYLPRAAFLMDGLMRWLGLDGRAFVLQVMGFGCNVPSIMGTRVIRDRGMRLLAMLCIPFALCQARLTVFIFMAAVFFPRPWWAPGLVVFGFYGLSFLAAVITGLLFKRAFPSREAFVLELPPYRSPSLSTILRRGWTSMLNFLVTTRVFIVVGAAAIWLLTNLPPGAVQGSGDTLADGIGQLFQPLLVPIGMNPALTVSLFFGFIAKEILLGAMAVIYATSEADLGGVIGQAITPLQALSFMTFVLLYTPCLGTVAAQLQESKSRGFTALSLGWSLALAWILALVVYQGGRLL
ncbi:ferrous iron transport protein B [Cyanobium sp. CH-040]|uniref:ferrous iron transport protein B n=1 Tax=Cyanobium sp. CH-040 TaxID=2823708 RepID=UPI0020CC9148|nr:ferrous iron transport protein B [Cyanobium sp. CH-040]MCP9928877.1 ferrous iron transport protein B [Cyanobium sp. CH-040]